MATTKTVARALSSIARTNNAEFWDLCRRFSTDFKQHTSAKTLAEFNEKGYESIKLTDISVLNDFFSVSMRVAFQILNVAKTVNPLVDKGLVQVYNTPNGGYVQRMAVNSVKPVSPAYTGLKDGDSVDPFVVRKPEISERFFQMNFDYQSLITIQEYQLKTMYINEYGVGELLAGILQGLENGYTIQEYLNIKQCFNAAINSTENPLQDSQVISMTSWTDGAPTDAELLEFVQICKDTATRMETVPSTSAFNAMKFDTRVNPSDMVLVMRAGIKNRIQTMLMVGAYNPEYLTLPFEIVEVDDFGGIEHYKEKAFTTPLYPVYDKLGQQIGWNEAEGQTVVTVANGADFKKDSNSGVLGMIMQKGAIFETAQNPYTVTPILNPRGLYTNYIANRPNNGINYDALYNVIVIQK